MTAIYAELTHFLSLTINVIDCKMFLVFLILKLNIVNPFLWNLTNKEHNLICV